jgi:hypothetical protein
MENCWFRLKQTHFPPPTLPIDTNGVGTGNGAICLGHIMVSMKELDHMDNIINRSVEGFTFTPAVPIYTARAWKMEWSDSELHQTGASGMLPQKKVFRFVVSWNVFSVRCCAATKASSRSLEVDWCLYTADVRVPIAEMANMSADAKAALAFRESTHDYRAFDRLDRYTILPTRGFIEGVLKSKEVESHIEKSTWLGAWSIVMITGVAIARGSRGSSSQNHGTSGALGGGV